MKFELENSGDKKQLVDSIDKLFHYLMLYVTADTNVSVKSGEYVVYEKKFTRLRSIDISPTLFNRFDDCHGAGNCCRVPFDLVYTEYDRSRILNADCKMFGADSEKIFNTNRDDLLNSLEPLEFYSNGSYKSNIYIKRNRKISKYSGNKSCPYLFTSTDRYYCGVHPFKPLHCWYPHMVVRSDTDSGSVMIARMQYGRNHKFGCPVIFQKTSEDEGLFGSPIVGEGYFQEQYRSDHDKLQWTANSIMSLGFNNTENVGVNLHGIFAKSRKFYKGTEKVRIWQ